MLRWIAAVGGFVAALHLLSGCQRPDGRREAAATTAAITRTADAVHNADAANARAQARNTAARTLAQQIADEAAHLLSSK